MAQAEILEAARGSNGGYKIDASRGERIARVSSEWFSRPSDERYLSLSDMYAAVRGRTERSRTRTIESAAIRVEASRDDSERLLLAMPGSGSPVAMTHWSFGQLASLVGTPAAYLRQLPAPLAGINLQYGLTSHRAEQVNPIEAGRLPDGSPDLFFRGFYCWNSEVGAKTLGIASFYLRAVCQNRNLWGVEDFEEITIRDSKYAASRFAHEAAPALTRFPATHLSLPMPSDTGESHQHS
jgi:hypothetical protein